jgi:hypothetical protein
MNFKKYVNTRLNKLKEDLVRDIDIPENTITYDGTLGSYVINPFTNDEYSLEVVLTNSEDLSKLISELDGVALNNLRTTDDGAAGHYILSGFFNESLLDDVQIVLKHFLNNIM